jgi:hypothetical protein
MTTKKKQSFFRQGDCKSCAFSGLGFEGYRSAVEVSIEKYEKTAMQWLQEQTQNN